MKLLKSKLFHRTTKWRVKTSDQISYTNINLKLKKEINYHAYFYINTEMRVYISQLTFFFTQMYIYYTCSVAIKYFSFFLNITSGTVDHIFQTDNELASILHRFFHASSITLSREPFFFPIHTTRSKVRLTLIIEK